MDPRGEACSSGSRQICWWDAGQGQCLWGTHALGLSSAVCTGGSLETLLRPIACADPAQKPQSSSSLAVSPPLPRTSRDRRLPVPRGELLPSP